MVIDLHRTENNIRPVTNVKNTNLIHFSYCRIVTFRRYSPQFENLRACLHLYRYSILYEKCVCVFVFYFRAYPLVRTWAWSELDLYRATVISRYIARADSETLAILHLAPPPRMWISEYRHFLGGWTAKSDLWIENRYIEHEYDYV